MKHYLQNDSEYGIKKLIYRYEHCLENEFFETFDEQNFIDIAKHYNLERFHLEAIRTIEIGIATFPKSRNLKKKLIVAF